MPDELIEDARTAVKSGRAASVSAYVSDALASYRRQQTLTELLAEWDSEDGGPTAQDYAWAEDQLARVAGEPAA